MNDDLNPALFAPDAVSPETRAVNAELARRALAAAAAPAADFATMRAAFNRGESAIPATPKSAHAKTVLIDARGGHHIALRIVAGPAPAGVYLHIHGGAWMVGAADMRDADLERIVETTGLACVSVEYRLAPEHPCPAAQDDCEAAARWLIDNAKALFGTQRLAIGGESAGAHLSVTTLLRLRDSGHATAFCAANLIYGVFDLSMTPSQRQADATLVVNRTLLEGAVAAFVPAHIDRRLPDVSPLYGDLRGLPPALFTVGTLDPLLDDSLFMHARWVAAGNQARLAIYPGGAHGFTSFQCALADEANALADQFLVSSAA
jgi:acetyl esterase